MTSLRISVVLAVMAATACESGNPFAVVSERDSGSRGANMVPFEVHQTVTLADPSVVFCLPGTTALRYTVASSGSLATDYTGEGFGCVRPAGAGVLGMVSFEYHVLSETGEDLRFTLDSAIGGEFVATAGPGGVVITSRAAFNIVGGTGRFAQATGHATWTVSGLEGEGNLIQSTISGVISSAAWLSGRPSRVPLP